MDTTAFIDRVKTTLEQAGTDCRLDDMMDLCPDLTWNQMFLAIDDLSRKGEVRVTIEADRTYRVQVRRPEASSNSPVMEREQKVL
jgi:hypothetical protein